jgi:rhamnosyltransferase
MQPLQPIDPGRTLPSPTDVPPADAPIAAIVVTYEPEQERLQRALAAVRPQVSTLIVVDNGSRTSPPRIDSGLATLIRLPGNVGVGAAQNAGIRAALAQGHRFVLLLDQDSVPAPDMTRRLLDAHDEVQRAGLPVGAVGARVQDPDGREDGFVRFRAGRYEAVTVPNSDEWIDCDMLIASGTLIPLASIERVGPMAEDLFIDKVDTEWCLRARAGGLHLIGARRALLHHRLGEGTVRIWFGRWRQLRLHQPFRYYYMVRNGLLLRRSPHRTPAWCRADLRQLLSIVLYFGLLKPRGFAPLRMMLRGLVDGLRQVSGPLR